MKLTRLMKFESMIVLLVKTETKRVERLKFRHKLQEYVDPLLLLLSLLLPL